MSVFFYKNKINLNILDINYNKTKINNLFLNNKYIIFINKNYISKFKDLFLNLDIISVSLKMLYIKTLFKMPNFRFLKGENIFCVFINNLEKFINVIKLLDNIQFYYIYNKSFSNLTFNDQILVELNKYKNNYIFIQFFLKKIIVKIIILLLFLLISLIKYIK
jgi:hypothetical protein